MTHSLTSSLARVSLGSPQARKDHVRGHYEQQSNVLWREDQQTRLLLGRFTGPSHVSVRVGRIAVSLVQIGALPNLWDAYCVSVIPLFPQDEQITLCLPCLAYSDCFSATSPDIIHKRCHGRAFCDVPATDSIFGDPCPTYGK